MKDKVDEYQNKLDCLNIINSIHKLESQIQNLDTKFRYAAVNQDVSNSNRNENGEESNDVDQNDEESKHGELLSQNNYERRIYDLPNQSKQLI